MSFDIKLTKDEECKSVNSTRYRGVIGLWYPNGTDIESVVYADYDHAGDYVDRKSASANPLVTTHENTKGPFSNLGDKVNLPPSPPSPPPNRTPPTSPITTNSLSSPSPPQNSTQNQIVHDLNELHHLSNLLDINLQQAIKATNPSPLLHYVKIIEIEKRKQVSMKRKMVCIAAQTSTHLLRRHTTPTMIIPDKNRKAISKYLFQEGVCFAKKDFNLAKHPEIDVPNLQVIKLMQSFKSKEYVKETFAWMHYYWFLTNDGIEFLRTYLNLPSDIVPATLKKSAKPLGRPMGGPPGDRPRGPPREGDRPRFGDRDGYRGGPRGPPGEFGGEKGGAPADYQPAFNRGAGGRPSFGRGGGGFGGGEAHPVLPNQNDMMHERPSGKIGLYTRFFDYANFRLPLSTFLVDVLMHFRINISQLSVIGATKEVSHLPKKLREDHGTPNGASVGGKSGSALQRLLAGAVLNAEVGDVAIPTLPFVIAPVSTTPEREDGDHTDSVAEPNLRTIGAPRRFVISSDSSHHSGTNVAEAEIDSLTRSSVPIMTTVTTTTSTVNPTLVTKDKFVEPSSFGAGSSSAGGTDPIMGVFSDLTSSDFLVGVIRTVISRDTDLQKVYVPQWSVTNGMEHDQLFTEFNVEATHQMSLSAEGELVKAREEEIESLKARLLPREAEAAEAIRLRAEASNFETVEKSFRDETNTLRKRNVILEKERNALDVKATELETSAMSKERELTDLNALVHELEISSSGFQEKVTVYENCMEQLEKFQDDRMKIVEDKWLLTHDMDLAVANCLNSPEYLSSLGAAIGKAIEKGMEDGLSAGITHGKEGRLQNVNFSLLARLKFSTDASVEAVMDILHLEGPLSEKLGLNELQPNVDQLMVPIHHSPDQVVVGATAVSLSLDVSSVRVRKIRENISNQRYALRDVFVPLAEPFSATVLTSTEGTSDTAAVTADTTMVPSKTFASASTIDPISVDDYKVMGADDQTIADENAASFHSVDDAELNISQ
nr:40S ribosomal protein S10-1-like [Tanacetum cinerariifolium]